jgi:peptide/nickel transport system substrate-binding protein
MVAFKKPELPDNETIRDRFEELEQASLSHAQKYLVRRWTNFKEVGRYAMLWLIVVMVLAFAVVEQTKGLGKYYQVTVPTSGGIYSEGVVGQAENFNPLFVGSEAEATTSQLLFSGLLKYDNHNDLVGNLASSWSADSSGTVYTVKLRSDARWQDGVAIHSDDVAYTVQMIQDPSTQSPLASSWKDVKVATPDPLTVTFTLSTPFPPFPYSLTSGIIPKHILESTPVFQLRTSNFNFQPTVSSGPFSFKEARTFGNHQEIQLVRNAHYYGGTVEPDTFIVDAYSSYDNAVAAFKNHEISALGGVQPTDVQDLRKTSDVKVDNAPLMHETFAFFRTTQGVLSDKLVRQALSLATDKPALVKMLGGTVAQANLPLLPGQLGYDKTLDVATFDVQKAGNLLDQAGWRKAPGGIRKKDGQTLQLNLVASSNEEYPQIAGALQHQWQSLGVIVKTNLIRPADFQQNILIPHSYDILLYELALGQDPDVYAYWHSSQASEKGLNLSEYRSQIADDSLEGGRSRTSPALRAAKYHAFLQQWVADTPAVALYQPSYSYAFRSSVSGFQPRTLVDPVDRFDNITDWSAATRQADVTH